MMMMMMMMMKSDRRLLDRSTNAMLPIPHLHLALSLGVIPSEFRRDLSRLKTIESLGYLSAVFLKSYNRLVTNGRTDGERTRDDSKYRTSVA